MKLHFAAFAALVWRLCEQPFKFTVAVGVEIVLGGMPHH